MTMDYKKSGVDVEAGDRLVDWLNTSSKPMPHAQRLVSGIGGFASLFNISFPEMKKPLLITCTDGVGTKVKLAAQFKSFKSVGQDLVAMCVNDLICTGGDPLLFLDYYATGKLELNDAQEFLEGVRNACIESDCNLVGGETAEMPGVYQRGDFDCAGFAVGVVDQEKVWGSHRVQVQDRLVAVASDGFHSNGFSLLRKIFEDNLEAHKEILLRPTALYVKLIQELKRKWNIKAAAHITGGGIDNIPRILPEGTYADLTPWPFPPEFLQVKALTGLSDLKLTKTLNCGIGMVLVVSGEIELDLIADIQKLGRKAWSLGEVKAYNGPIEGPRMEPFVTYGGLFE